MMATVMMTTVMITTLMMTRVMTALKTKKTFLCRRPNHKGSFFWGAQLANSSADVSPGVPE